MLSSHVVPALAEQTRFSGMGTQQVAQGAGNVPTHVPQTPMAGALGVMNHHGRWLQHYRPSLRP
jgi:hypothetical protein